jgi:hypothetical protein
MTGLEYKLFAMLDGRLMSPGQSFLWPFIDRRRQNENATESIATDAEVLSGKWSRDMCCG